MDNISSLKQKLKANIFIFAMIAVSYGLGLFFFTRGTGSEGQGGATLYVILGVVCLLFTTGATMRSLALFAADERRVRRHPFFHIILFAVLFIATIFITPIYLVVYLVKIIKNIIEINKAKKAEIR